MNRCIQHPERQSEMTRKITFICLAVVFAALAYRGAGGPNAVSKGLCTARGFAERKTAILTATVQGYGEHITRLQAEIQAVLRAVSRIQKELRSCSQSHKTTPSIREAAPTGSISAHESSQSRHGGGIG